MLVALFILQVIGIPFGPLDFASSLLPHQSLTPLSTAELASYRNRLDSLVSTPKVSQLYQHTKPSDPSSSISDRITPERAILPKLGEIPSSTQEAGNRLFTEAQMLDASSKEGDAALAFVKYKQAAEMKNVNALIKLTQLYESGSQYVAVDKAAARLLYKQADGLDARDKEFWLINHMISKPATSYSDPIINSRLFANADNGHMDSQLLLADRIMAGTAFYAPNTELAKVWYLRAALQGSPRGLFKAVDILYPGEINSPKAIKILEYTAKKHTHLPTFIRLGEMYTKIYKSQIAMENTPEKLETARKAQTALMFGAEGGDAASMFELGELYMSGSLGFAGDKFAPYWYYMAAKKGYHGSFEKLVELASARGTDTRLVNLLIVSLRRADQGTEGRDISNFWVVESALEMLRHTA